MSLLFKSPIERDRIFKTCQQEGTTEKIESLIEKQF